MASPQSQPAPRRAILPLQVVCLSAFWCLFSGKFDLVHLSYGVLSIVLVMILTRHLKLGASTQDENEFLGRVRWARALFFPFWLLWEIITSNFQMAMIILGPRSKVDPVLLRFDFPVDDDVAKVTLGNSITLTPGTYTLRIRGHEFVVHSINHRMAESLIDGSMQRVIAGIFGADPPAPDVRLETRFVPTDREAD